MRSFLENIDKIRIKNEVSTEYEIAALSKKTKKALVFEDVKGFDKKVVTNLASTRKKVAKAIGCKVKEIPSKIQNGIEDPKEINEVKGKIDTSKPDLNKIPILKHYKRDAGPYITSGIVVAEDKEGERNASIHRMLVKDRDKLGIRIVERHLYDYYKEGEKKDKDLDIAIAIGVHPSILLASATRVPRGFDEFKLANSLNKNKNKDGINLLKCDSVDLEVPEAEIILEGKIKTNIREKEGPFVDITGTYDGVRQQPIIELTGMWTKENPIYHGLLPAESEHKLMMGLPYEPLIMNKVNEVCKVKNAILTDGGSGYLHGVVQIEKRNKKDGKKAINAAMDAHSSMKHCLVIDEDTDIYDKTDLERAIATRVKGDEDIHIFSDVKGSSLDPRGEKDGTVTKVGMDATKVIGTEEKVNKVKVPLEDEIELEDYID
ncbi:MAG: 3-polyprenyl-4-hydroxybenzoate decarboxylase UbiD [Candidatus Methanohalarchaeum thermophilum]|uniref:Anhydromevalonate phosphate decarboxylase n=1 Tax=Methanohalarchaeum thermophilum TaxID=1903181 RepID=A0A1Q6DXQ7_METT1|nr:MAG: 3-polyprenyl-4-hydroxybenzoate decarboxylase UbiD [Candidatus Methanohalarchaeum thermophilum]